MDFTLLTHYIESLYQHYPQIAQAEFVQQTELKNFVPVIETETARLLMVLLRLKAPRRVLEIGTSIGYSTVSMAQVVKEWRGRVISLEFDETVAAQARRNFARAGVADTIDLVLGDARQLLPTMTERFDFIFLDAYNDIYPELCADCVRLLNKGGLLIADDTLGPVREGEGGAASLQAYNELIAHNPELESTLIAVGDGLTFAVKK